MILTYNEFVNIADCIASIPSDDVVVFDSLSTDDTCIIALGAGARVLERPFDTYARQRNAALQLPIFKYPWVLMLDADERMTSALHDEIVARLERVGPETGMFRMRRQDIFLGRWLRRSSGYPTWFGRLMRCGAAHVERDINEEFRTELTIEELANHILHYPFNKGVDYWFERHNRYSSMEAEALERERLRRVAWRDILSRDPMMRRKAAKQLVYRMPMRPTLIFLYLYIARGGFLDGRAGFLFCRMRAVYESMIDIKSVILSSARSPKDRR
ncbi:glycosyltransferase family 2 protein [Sphingomonas sp. MMS12-HWE2-04]|uniref:glycosyltransferase family 2 protein n=1 Tax=Sphingomonas sp. MMS12-HWE2-04 TaxID=3234199 RepID=UPI00384E6338